ncbi:MAG: polyprenyl synthetase family protein [Actinomycetota bacterium]|nr:polyprenyl synthetase family protein [Actinomycetota bacterium]
MDVLTLGELLDLGDLPDRLGRVESRLAEVLQSDVGAISDPSLRVTQAGGKRLRPILALAAAASFDRFDDRVVAGATAVELVHVGSLVHDDVFDRALRRRGVPTVNAVEGESRAVMVGDYLLARAGEEAARVSAEVAATLAWTITQLCLGQHLETVDVGDLDRSVERYTRSIRGKTASLLAASCRIGVQSADGDEAASEAMARYGDAFGMAFQILDDVLDLTSTEEAMGKPVGNDLRSGVYTLPVLVALDGPDGEELRALLDDVALGDRNGSVEPRLGRAVELVRASEGVDAALAEVDRHCAVAVGALDALGDGPVATGLRDLPERYRQWVLATVANR